MLWLVAALFSGYPPHAHAQDVKTHEIKAQETPILKTQPPAAGGEKAVSEKPGGDQSAKAVCLSSFEVRGLVERGEVIPVHKAMQIARGHFGGEIVKARLCPEQDRLIYLLTLLDKNSQIRLVTMDARNGQLLVRP